MFDFHGFFTELCSNVIWIFLAFKIPRQCFTVWATYVLSFLFNDQGVFPCFFDVMFPISQPMKNFVFMTNCPSSPSNPDICLIKDYISRI